LEIHVTSGQRIEWFGEFALTILTFGFLYIVIRMTDGPQHQPAIALPIVWRLVLVLVLAIVATAARIWLTNWRKRRRQQIQ
jgi:hypothetical protein